MSLKLKLVLVAATLLVSAVPSRSALADPLVRNGTNSNCAITDVSPGATACFGWYDGNTSKSVPEILALLTGVYGGTWANGGKTDGTKVGGSHVQAGPFKPFFEGSIKNFADADLEFLIPQSGLFAVALKAGPEFGIYVFNTGSLSSISINMPNNKALSNAMLFTNTNIPEPNIVVPEPSTYAMMLVGLAGFGVAARRRRKV